jgi:hypothetical protein
MARTSHVAKKYRTTPTTARDGQSLLKLINKRSAKSRFTSGVIGDRRLRHVSSTVLTLQNLSHAPPTDGSQQATPNDKHSGIEAMLGL